MVEVRSPRDRPGAVIAKAGEYLAAGAQVVWVVDPERAVVTVFVADGGVREYGEGDSVPGEPLLPGFRLPVEAVFTG